MARPVLSSAEKAARLEQRKSIGRQMQAAVDSYLLTHPDTTQSQIAAVLGLSPQHLIGIFNGKPGPSSEVLSRTAHFFSMNIEFRGRTFTPDAFQAPTSPVQAEGTQLQLRFGEPVLLNGVEVQMRVIEEAVDHWQLDIRVVRTEQQPV